MLKSVDQLPVVHVSRDFPYKMPFVMAQAALEHGPIFKVDWPTLCNMVCLLGPEANHLVFHKRADYFSHEVGWSSLTIFTQTYLGRGLLRLDGEEHVYYRKLINPALTVRSCANHLTTIYHVVKKRISRWETSGVINLYQELGEMLFEIAIRAFLGIQDEDDIALLSKAFDRLLYSRPDSHETLLLRSLEHLQAKEDIDSILCLHIARRRQAPQAEPPRDLLDILVHAQNWQEAPLSNEDILGHIRSLIAASHESSAVTGCWLLYLLAKHPAYLRRVEQELASLPGSTLTLEDIKAMPLLDYALDETGRLCDPAKNLPRSVTKDVEFAGYLLPKGTPVLLSIAGCHKLPTIFAHPEIFDPDRFAPPREEDKKQPYALATFGSGSRKCIGYNFARIQLKIIASSILRTYTLELLPGQNIAMPDAFLRHGLMMEVQSVKRRFTGRSR